MNPGPESPEFCFDPAFERSSSLKSVGRRSGNTRAVGRPPRLWGDGMRTGEWTAKGPAPAFAGDAALHGWPSSVAGEWVMARDAGRATGVASPGGLEPETETGACANTVATEPARDAERKVDSLRMVGDEPASEVTRSAGHDADRPDDADGEGEGPPRIVVVPALSGAS